MEASEIFYPCAFCGRRALICKLFSKSKGVEGAALDGGCIGIKVACGISQVAVRTVWVQERNRVIRPPLAK
jgi:hypothetical protein